MNDISVDVFIYMVEGSGTNNERFFHKFSDKKLKGGKLRVWEERREELLGPGLQQAPPLYPQNIAKRSVFLPQKTKNSILEPSFSSLKRRIFETNSNH